MGDCKKITATAKEMVVNVVDGSKTAAYAFKEISANLKTVSLAAKAPLKRFEVNLKGFGEERLPEPALFRYNEDNAKAADTFSKLFGRPIAELSSATEVFSISAAKTLIDLRSTSDSLLLVVSWVRDIGDGPQSQFANGDILSARLAKVLSEQALTVDTVAKSFATPFSDSNLATDIIASTIQSTKQDGFATSDAITFLVDFRPLIQDWVYSTDDVLGSANIDDDQYAFFGKVAIDSVAPDDIVLSSVLKGLEENIAPIDAIAKSVSVPLTDTGGTIDTITLETSFYRSLVDATAPADVILSSISKGLNDNLAPIDAIAKSAGVPLTDSVGVPDALGKVLTTPKADATVASDVLEKSLTASKVDAAGVSETCTANLQNYMSALYVNVGYVGVNYAL